MSEKFTKGPWTSKGDWMIVDQNDRLIAQFEPLNDGLSNGNTDESFANTSLIAAAPDMYEMLSKLSGMLTDINAHVLAKEIESLLAKARGEA